MKKHNFTLKEEAYLPLLKSHGQVWEHEKSGARLVFLPNDDDNKVFGIGFRTPSEDSTGVAHIVEHSVLSGSRKYKTREPFMDLVSGSLQTFLNAMTYPDKTLYPVASRNTKDFYNLIDVYLDGVFFPAFYENPMIFQQEGWHLELLDPEEDLSYRGVVYNEMRGSISSPETQVSLAINRQLHPESSYRFSSGGDPYVIPDLTYEDFIAFHQKYYHPSNSYIFIYGDVDQDDMFAYLDKDYLSHFEAKFIDSKIDMDPVPALNRKPVQEYYSIAEGQDPENQSYLTYNLIAGEYTDTLSYYMRSIMADVLVNAESAPLRKALLDGEFGEDISCWTSASLPLDFSIVVKNGRKSDLSRFEKTVDDTLLNLMESGLDKNLILSVIRKMAFDLREVGDYPTRGVIYFISAMSSWVYDRSPLEILHYEPYLETLEQGVDTGIFEDWIRENFFDNRYRLVMSVDAKPGLFEEKDLKTKEDLRAKKASMTKEALNQLIQANKALLAFQMTDDSKEAKATIPSLDIEDIPVILPDPPLEVEAHHFMPLYYSPQQTQGVFYTKYLFDLRVLDKEDIPYVGLMADLLGKLDTKNYSFSDLNNEIYLYTGGISMSTSVVQSRIRQYEYLPTFSINGKALKDGLPKLMELMAQIIFKTRWDDRTRIRQLIGNIYSQEKMDIIPSAHSVAVDRVSSHFLDGDAFDERLSGLDYLFFLEDIVTGKLPLDLVISRIQSVMVKLFKCGHGGFHITADPKDEAHWRQAMDIFFHELPDGEDDRKLIHFGEKRLNEGFILPANVQYVSAGYLFPDFAYDGSWAVLSTVLSDDYLHNHIRARGGAYGAGMGINRSGLLTTYSYRDPHLPQTLKTYWGMGDHLRSLKLSNRDLKDYIIGTANRFNPPLTPSSAGAMALSRYLAGVSHEEVLRNYGQVLSTTMDDLKEKAEVLDVAMEKASICVLGGAEKLRAEKDRFSRLVLLPQ